MTEYLRTDMEEWELDFEWLRVRHLVKRTMNRSALPDMNAILYLIGIQELGRWQEKFTKEEKQDLMHIAVCRLLSYSGYYEFEGRDQDGWPHYNAIRPIDFAGVDVQEKHLKVCIIKYFKDLELENGGLEEE
jgi:hypothetical protein